MGENDSWWREVTGRYLTAEEFWLAANIYCTAYTLEPWARA